jgi:hypothetical protein
VLFFMSAYSGELKVKWWLFSSPYRSFSMETNTAGKLRMSVNVRLVELKMLSFIIFKHAASKWQKYCFTYKPQPPW